MTGSPDLVLQHPKLASLLAYWKSKCAAGKLPPRGAIDPLEMGDWLGNLLLIGVGADGAYRYRLYGSEFVEEFGREMTGRTLDELPADQRQLITDEYTLACATGAPSVRTYTAEFLLAPRVLASADSGIIETWERLVLPLATDGLHVDMLLVGAYKLAGARPSM